MRVSAVALLFLVGLSCSRDYAPYSCTNGSQCFFEGQQGRCEPSGHCSFVDSACLSGYRYAQFVDGKLSNACVPPPCGGPGQACCSQGPACTASNHQCEAGTCSLKPCISDTAPGWRHTCALRRDGTVWCWGANSRGQLGNPTVTASVVTTPVQVTGIADAVEVASGDEHACARLSSGAVFCWGENGSQQLGAPSPANTSMAVEVRLADGSPVGAIALKAGAEHTCALRSDHTVICWGVNAQGQLGRPTTTSGGPAPVDGLADVAELVLGAHHSCARRSSRDVVCWGENSDGQLGAGQGAPTSRSTAEPVRNLGNVDRIFSDGSEHTCALSQGALWCWGKNSDYQLGNGGNAAAAEPVRASTATIGTVSEVATSDGATCLLNSEGAIYCWGRKRYGEVAQPGPAHEHTIAPALVPNLSRAIGISGGETHFCAHLRSGQLFCWGNNQRGQIGNGQASGHAEPMALPLGQVSQVSVGPRHTCAVTLSDRLYCWGANERGQLGDGTRIDRTKPTSVKILEAGELKPLSNLFAVAVGAAHTCAKTDAGTFCWGDNSYKQLGVEGMDQSSHPVAVASSTNGRLAAGERFSCITANEGIICWGDNSRGQLGLGPSHPPAPDANLARKPVLTDRFHDLHAGRAHICIAPFLGGSLTCWGDNTYGQLGASPALNYSPSPLVVSLPGTFDNDAAVGWNHTCAVVSNRLYCWGRNDSGQLGDGTRIDRRTPTLAMAPGATDVYAGHTHTCMLPSGGVSVLCVGTSEWDALGTGAESQGRVRLTFSEPLLTRFDALFLALGDQTTFAQFSLDYSVQMWGQNFFGNLGDGTVQQVIAPVSVPLVCVD